MLNAFRHHRGRHPHGLELMHVIHCAQRLSASQRSARSAARLDRAMGSDVLNAFRHHRGRHIGGRISVASRSSSAQRLSASQRSAHDATR